MESKSRYILQFENQGQYFQYYACDDRGEADKALVALLFEDDAKAVGGGLIEKIRMSPRRLTDGESEDVLASYTPTTFDKYGAWGVLVVLVLSFLFALVAIYVSKVR